MSPADLKRRASEGCRASPQGALAGPTTDVRIPDHVPAEWQEAATPAPPRRDVALDLIRGLAMVILVLNHVKITSAIEYAGATVISAAEVLVAVSGVVVGIVFGGRWLTKGRRETTLLLLRRSRKLYLASVVVVGLVAALTLVPWLNTDALAISPTADPARDMYAYDSFPRLLLAIVTLEAGPWQFNILGFFIASLALAPLVLYALDRGWLRWIAGVSIGLYLFGRTTHIDVLPSQSERPFPILVWQVLFVGGMAVGWYRQEIAVWFAARKRLIGRSVVALAVGSALALIAAQALLPPTDWALFEGAHFDKGTLDVVRVASFMSMTVALYLSFRRFSGPAQRFLGPVLLPLGQNSFYVFIVHVFICLAVMSVPALAAGGYGLLGNSVIEIGVLALLWVMVTRRFLFRWIPR